MGKQTEFWWELLKRINLIIKAKMGGYDCNLKTKRIWAELTGKKTG
jgi:hypothetical protein